MTSTPAGTFYAAVLLGWFAGVAARAFVRLYERLDSLPPRKERTTMTLPVPGEPDTPQRRLGERLAAWLRSDRVTSWVRTVVPGLWSAGVAYLVALGLPAWLTEPANGLGQTAAVPIVLGAVYAGLRWLEPRVPSWLARFLLGSSRPPTYDQE
ncbi:hypothetical protein AB0L41_45525 [Amycolatopsis mediterranei]|uniref:hypothetical protein n=1 Tax=Amycolatopsis mediterranei TaxID=33910 RepID=UPI0034385D48